MEAKKKQQVSLLDEMANYIDCVNLSDLRYIDDEGQTRRLIQLLRSLSTDRASLFEWNDALYYLTAESA